MRAICPASSARRPVDARPPQLRELRWRRAPTCARAAASGGGGSSGPSQRLRQALDEIDALNAEDPRSVEWQGRQVPYELAYSEWVTDWVKRLEPQPSEELLIVARGQHVQRWTSPRSSYPEGRAGYLQWREDLKQRHAQAVVGVMARCGFGEASQERVRRIILKKDLKRDPENQVVEDALCLVFLQHQFADLLAKEGPDKMVDIVRKTWVTKMGERGRAAALELDLPPDQADVVRRALGE